MARVGMHVFVPVGQMDCTAPFVTQYDGSIPENEWGLFFGPNGGHDYGSATYRVGSGLSLNESELEIMENMAASCSGVVLFLASQFTISQAGASLDVFQITDPPEEF